eukprot:11092902-Heterocapsa_arctica.AAC.1
MRETTEATSSPWSSTSSRLLGLKEQYRLGFARQFGALIRGARVKVKCGTTPFDLPVWIAGTRTFPRKR